MPHPPLKMGWLLFGLLLYFLVLLAERAVVSLSPHDVEQLRANPSASTQRAYTLVSETRTVMAALLLARLLLKLFLLVFPASFLIQSQNVSTFLHNLSLQIGLPVELIWLASASLYALIFASLFWFLKKADNEHLAINRPALVVKRLSLFIFYWKKLFAPFIKIRRRVEKGNGSETSSSDTNTTTVASEKREIELLKSIVKFGDVTVKQVMRPRSKVVAIDFRASFHDLLAIVRQTEFSRFPVYDEDLDNVTGILYVKDLVPHLSKIGDFEWQPLIRTNVLLVPESKRGTELLQEFKQQKIHMAVVVDEYGGSSGIVTLEDILEEVTGDIRDEFDEESEVRYRKLDDSTYLFEGQTLLNDVCRFSGLDAGTFDSVRGAADTLAGLALELKGDIPKVGAEIAWNGFLLTVIAADNRRIEQLKLTLPR